MNISEKTNLVGIKNTGCSIGHIQHCLNGKDLHKIVNYDYCGKDVQRGTVELTTKNGTFQADFVCRNNWLTELNFNMI